MEDIAPSHSEKLLSHAKKRQNCGTKAISQTAAHQSQKHAVEELEIVAGFII